MEKISIKQRKENCHYETIMWTNLDFRPICCGYGFTQSDSDTNCILEFLKKRFDINI